MLSSSDGHVTVMLMPQYTLLFSNSPDYRLYSLGLITWKPERVRKQGKRKLRL
jgi:hypothetical protein